MKLVKESLFEKFTEDSDPVDDMGIGNEYILKTFIKEVQKEKAWPIEPGHYIKVCIEYDKLDLVKFLVEKRNVDVNLAYKSTRNLSKPPLIYAIIFNREEIIKYLVEHGADVNILWDENSGVFVPYSILYFATQYCDLPIIKYLIDKGAQYSKSPNDINSLAEIAASNNKIEILKYFLLNGADVDKILQYGLIRQTSTKVKNALKQLKIKPDYKIIKNPTHKDIIKMCKDFLQMSHAFFEYNMYKEFGIYEDGISLDVGSSASGDGAIKPAIIHFLKKSGLHYYLQGPGKTDYYNWTSSYDHETEIQWDIKSEYSDIFKKTAKFIDFDVLKYLNIEQMPTNKYKSTIIGKYRNH